MWYQLQMMSSDRQKQKVSQTVIRQVRTVRVILLCRRWRVGTHVEAQEKRRIGKVSG